MSVESQESFTSGAISEDVNLIAIRSTPKHTSLLYEEVKVHSKRNLIEKEAKS